MKQIWRIYTTDLRNVAKHWAAIVIVLGLMILPSLYAWFNIKASWDPYGNTKDVPIAVSNQDAGSNLRGKDINIGNEIVDSLKKNKNMGWKFVDEKQAIYGVEHGDYYASITIPKDFSEKIATVISDNPQKPELDYFVNEKVNAIAPKITAKGASGITEEISKNFVKTANGEIFEIFNDLGIDLETNLPSIEKVKDLVFKLEAEFPEMYKLVDTALDDATRAQDLVKVAQEDLPIVESVMNDGQDALKNLDTFFARNDQTLKDAPGVIRNDLTVVKDAMDKANAFTNFLMHPGVDLNLPEFPSLSQIPQLNDEGYKNIAKNINQTVNNALSSARTTTAYAQSVMDGLSNGKIDPEIAKKNIETISNNYQTHIDNLSSIIDMMSTLQNDEKTGFGDRVTHLTAIRDGLQDLNNRFKHLNDLISTGQEVNQDVRDGINQKLNTVNGLIDQAEKDYNDTFVADYKKAVQFKEQTESKINEDYEKAKAEYNKVKEDLQTKGVNGVESTKVALNSLNGQLQAGISMIDDIIPVLESTNKVLGDVNSDKNLDNGIAKLNKVKSALEKGVDATNKGVTLINNGQKPTKDVIESINEATKMASTQLGDFLAKYDSEIVPNFNAAIARTKEMSKNTSKLLNDTDKKLPDVKKLLEDSSKGLVEGTKKVEDIKAEMPATEKKIKELADKIRKFESEEDIKDIIKLLKNDVEQQSDYFANPVNLKENKLFAMPNYGSGMSPFYTVLALWVGALLMVSLLTVEVHEPEANYKSHEIYFGRFLTFLTIGLAQAFIVSMGDIFLLGTYVVDKFWFVLFSLFIGGVFVCIVYSLVSVFGNIGKSMAIILLVLQVAGSGGTFPIQMLPKFFQSIYPFLPFTYAISVIRETVGGMLWDIVIRDLLVLSVFVVIMLVLALVLKTPINKSSEKFVENAKGSKIIH
ncbi:phage infection protein [Bacillus pseudomycoides]|uniref:YhgE/Pip domain-containing protein n=1 Tax=Bacillus pseudomycoides TaxID=64104 RepID=UPI000BED3BA3|nr:YhgE/Pip domain-containing protein [Bacillus pseudomycoides]PDZ13728.1 phage infection protein [Bacillus pseudomycoides]